MDAHTPACDAEGCYCPDDTFWGRLLGDDDPAAPGKDWVDAAFGPTSTICRRTTVAEHAYEPDAQSGAGNCTCGASREHRRHPHRFRRAHGPASHCVCGLNPVAPIHNVAVQVGGSAQ